MTMLGMIGGTGLDDPPALTDVETVHPLPPFGLPNSPMALGTPGALRLAFLARHGQGHVHSPSDVPRRANIFALRALGATHVLGVSAVGSLKERLPPLNAVVPDQIIDRTVSRARTFF